MLLVAGGELDINLGRLLRRVLDRGIGFRELLVGPSSSPRIDIDPAASRFAINGEKIEPSGVFIRHDVFWPAKSGSGADAQAALNWHHAVRGWFAAHRQVRMFNRHSFSAENLKVENLLFAQAAGLATPHTLITNNYEPFSSPDWIQKPVAGGEYTTLAPELAHREGPQFPRFFQLRLNRPELRVFRVGASLMGFELTTEAIDYRSARDVKIVPVPVPREIAPGLLALSDTLGLDFAAADFMRDERGQMVFLEINSQPMFAAFDDRAGGKVCDAIIDYLTER